MLVLTRKLQQQIKIGSEITVTILKVKGNTVRVGIDAPREVRVVRGELPKLEAAAEVEFETAGKGAEALAAAPAMAAEEEAAVAADGPAALAAGKVPGAADTIKSAAHLPLGRIHALRGEAPLRHLIASCGALAK